MLIKLNQTRLHKFIAQHRSLRGEYTIGDIQNNIEKYGVFIDNQLVRNRLQWVFEGQKVELANWPERKKGDLSRIRIVDEQEDFVVLFKPSGVVVHPGAGQVTGTLLDWILENVPGQKELLQDAPITDNAHVSAGLVHRLDKDTAGLILVAKTLTAHTGLQNLFRDRKVQKHYLAVMSGNLTQRVELKGYQCRDKRNPRLQKFFVREKEALQYDPKARFSYSVFQPLQYDQSSDQTLVNVQIHTGRMHQIRVQAQYLGHPILNDPLYGELNNAECAFSILAPYLPTNGLQLLSNQVSFGQYTARLIEL